jgi:hypothetical protein
MRLVLAKLSSPFNQKCQLASLSIIAHQFATAAIAADKRGAHTIHSNLACFSTLWAKTSLEKNEGDATDNR